MINYILLYQCKNYPLVMKLHCPALKFISFFKCPALRNINIFYTILNLIYTYLYIYQHVGDLYMPRDSVSHIPDIKEININPVFPNRTALLHLHNMALSRYR